MPETEMRIQQLEAMADNVLNLAKQLRGQSLEQSGEWQGEIFSADVYDIRDVSLGTLPTEWLISETHALSALNMLQSMSDGDLARMRADWMARQSRSSAVDEDKPQKPYKLIDNVAYLNVIGMMQKQETCMSMMFGDGTSTVMVRRALRTAAADYKAKEIAGAVIVWDSGGGYVNGAFDLALDIRRVNELMDGMLASYGEDCVCSAAVLGATQAGRFYGNMNVETGSIGVLSQLVDSSEANKARGIKLHMIKTGKHKGIGMGDTVTQEQIDYMQGRANKIQSLFVKMVSQARNLNSDQMSKVTDASVFIGQEGVKYGLLDGIKSLDELHQEMSSGKKPKNGGKVYQMSNEQANTDIDRLLSEIDKQDLPTIEQQAAVPVQPTTPIVEPTVTANNKFEEMLQSAGVVNQDMAAVAANAALGERTIATARERAKKLANVALGVQAQSTYASIESADADLLNSYITGFIAMAEKQGLLNANGTPKLRVSNDVTEDTRTANEKVMDAGLSLLKEETLLHLYCI